MKLIILVVVILTVLFGVSLMRMANGLAGQEKAQLNEVMKELK